MNSSAPLRYFRVLMLLFGLIYGLTSLVNHYQFRTYALDLGAYHHALYDYAHFQWNDSGILKTERENLLADHFDLYLPALSPLAWIFGSYTLLIAQILGLLLGGWGVFQYFRNQDQQRFLPVYAAAFFWLFFGVFSALAYDYHSNVVAACLVPWLFLYAEKGRWWKAAGLLLLILVAKENMALWAAFLGLGFAWLHRKQAPLRNFGLLSALASGLFFVAVVGLIMPAFASSGHYPHFKYSTLGDGFSEAIVYLTTHPIEAFTTLFTNHTGAVDGDFVKLELHLLLLVSGLPLLIRKPQFLLMLVPIYFQKLFHDNYHMWGITGQYSIEYAPVLTIGLFSVVKALPSLKWQKWLAPSLVLLAAIATFRTMDQTVMHTDKSRIRFYQARHYQRNYDIEAVREQLKNIPPEAVVSVQSPFLPHLAWRDTVYQFPTIQEAEYLVFSSVENPYPMEPEQFTALTGALMKSSEWEVLHNSEAITLLKRQ